MTHLVTRRCQLPIKRFQEAIRKAYKSAGLSITYIFQLEKCSDIGGEMNRVPSVKPAGGPPLQLFNCAHAECGATFTKQWRLKEHETVHTGAV